MKQSKFSLADVLTVLTALAFGFVCFLGINFYTLGDTSQSFKLASLITILLAGTALLAKILKRTNRHFKTYLFFEILTLVVFTGLMTFFAYSPFPHYFNVSSNKKEIQDKLHLGITQAGKMFSEYERYAANRENLYKAKLQSVVAAKKTNPQAYKAYGFQKGSVSDGKQMDNKMFTLHADLFPTNYSDNVKHNGLKEVATRWLEEAKNTTNSWKPIGVVSVVNDVEQNSINWLNQLDSISSIRENGEQAIDFEYKLSFNDVKTHFSTLTKPNPLSIGLAVGAYLLMLLSYLISSRSSKSIIGTVKRLGKYDIEI